MSRSEVQSLRNSTLTRQTGPSQRAVSLAEAKQTLRLSQSDTTHDTDLYDAIDAATEQVEQDTDRCIINQDFAYHANRFPLRGGPIVLAQKPVQTITAITYLNPVYDADATDPPENQETLTFDSDAYSLDQGRREIFLKHGYEWPTALAQQNAITVTYVCGYGVSSNDVPRLLKRALLLQVGFWFTDPVMESADNYAGQQAYERIIARLLRTSYP